MSMEAITLSMEFNVTSSNVLRITIHWLSVRRDVGLTQGSLITKEHSHIMEARSGQNHDNKIAPQVNFNSTVANIMGQGPVVRRPVSA